MVPTSKPLPYSLGREAGFLGSPCTKRLFAVRVVHNRSTEYTVFINNVLLDCVQLTVSASSRNRVVLSLDTVIPNQWRGDWTLD